MTPVAVVLTLCAAAVLAGMRSFTAIAGWVADVPAELARSPPLATVANVLSMGFVTGMKDHGAAGLVDLLVAGAAGVVGLRCDRPGQGWTVPDLVDNPVVDCR